ncbi:MAG: cytochrome b/b6 domain-containing protein [Acidobacteria bacterium]|nr:cytochrome b/b6 domain-containing protein [Acidobacteriota bacterium]
MRVWVRSTTLWAAGWAGVGFGLAQAPAENAACASCHDQPQKMQNTAHESLGCATCHPQHEKYPHPTGIAKPTCVVCHSNIGRDYARGVHGQAARQGSAAPDCTICHGSAHEVISPRSLDFRQKTPDTCGMCHEQVVAQYKASVHGQALKRGVYSAPLCTDCHGEHSIQPHSMETSPVNVRHIRETCARCHGDVQLTSRFGLPADRVVSFDATFHGLAARAGSQTVANCASCHGVHNIFPSSDPRSTVNPKNLPTTCGRCHPGAGKRFVLGPVHQWDGRAEVAAVRWARWIYLVLIPVLVGLMLLHNAGDWVRKLLERRLSPTSARNELVLVAAKAPPELRMFTLERVQHVLLALSFVVLAWTGFALKYPDPWWARPLTLWGANWGLRGIIHRVASVVFLATGMVHMISLATSPRLRRHWQSLWPVRRDVAEGWYGFLYNLGLRSRRPPHSAHGYVEKFEYWAVVWGAVIMGITGIILWAHDFALSRLPRSWIDFCTTIHFYEAVLASLAVLVWHLYSVVLDPDVYPMDTAWLSGYSPRPRPDEPAEQDSQAPVEQTFGPAR